MAQTFNNGDQLGTIRSVLNGNASNINTLQSQNAKSVNNVSDLLANTTLTYTTGTNNSVVAGNIIQTRAENFSYQVAASTVSDQHVTTAGGVKLYVQPGDAGYNVKAFGAVGDGVADDTAAIQVALDAAGAAFPDALKNGCVYIPSGVFRCASLTLSGQSGIDVVGARQPAFSAAANNDGARLVYTGSGYLFNVQNTDPLGNSFAYRYTFKNFGVWFENSAASGAFYCVNLQESTFENVGINGATGRTNVYGIRCDGLSITNIDRCVFNNMSNAIYTDFLVTSKSAGAVNITRCNIYNSNVVFNLGLVDYANISQNWVEGFQTAILADNSSPRIRAKVVNLNVCDNVFVQSTAGLTQTRFLKVESSDNARTVVFRGVFARNTAYMNSGTATAPSYAASFLTGSNAAGVDIDVAFLDNKFWGVVTAGVYSDRNLATLSFERNDSRSNFLGTVVPNFEAPFAISEKLVVSQTGAGTSAPANTSENVLVTARIPGNLLGKNGQIKVTTLWSHTNNANAKTVRVRFGWTGGVTGTVVSQVSVASQSSSTVSAELTNRNSLASQAAIGTGIVASGNPQLWLVGASLDTSSDQFIAITAEKANGADSMTLESYSIEVCPR